MVGVLSENRLSSGVFPVFLYTAIARIRDHVRQIRKGDRSGSRILCAVLDFVSFFYFSVPMAVLIGFAIINKEAYVALMDRLDLVGAMFGIFTWISFGAKMASDYFNSKIPRVDGEKE